MAEARTARRPPPQQPAPQLEGLHQVQFRLVRQPDGERRLVALRDLNPGQLIFSEAPLASGPGDKEGICTVCYRISTDLCKRCWWPVCQACQESPAHVGECRILAACTQHPDGSLPTPFLLALRLLLLREQGGRDWDTILSLAEESPKTSQDLRPLHYFLTSECGLSVTKEETQLLIRLTQRTLGLTVEGRQVEGIYPTAALLPHSCSPNTRAVYRRSGHKLMLHSTTFIQRGEVLSLSRLRNQELLLTGRLERQQLLGTACQCKRCEDPTELGTNASSVRCQKCPNGLCLPPLDPNSPWKCTSCPACLSPHLVSSLILSLQEEDHCHNLEEVEFWAQQQRSILPPDHWIITRLRTRHFFAPGSGTVEDLWRRISSGRRLLKLADTFEPGLSAAREAILVNLATSLQFLLGEEVVARMGGKDGLLLSEEQLWAAFRDAQKCFQEALEAAQLEEDPDDPSKTPTLMIEENMKILEDMRADFENMTS